MPGTRRGSTRPPTRGRRFYTDAEGQSVEETGRGSTPTYPGAVAAIEVRTPPTTPPFSSSRRSRTAMRPRMRISAIMPWPTMKSAGSSLKFCLVCDGRAGSLPPPRPYHGMGHGSGDAVLRGAGGHVDRLRAITAPSPYGKPGSRQRLLHRPRAGRRPEAGVSAHEHRRRIIPAPLRLQAAIRASRWRCCAAPQTGEARSLIERSGARPAKWPPSNARNPCRLRNE